MGREEMEQKAVLEERYKLAVNRIREVSRESFENKEFKDYFDRVAEFLLMMDETREFLASGGQEKASLGELQRRNHELYADVLPENYDKSYANPDYAMEKLGEYGHELSWLGWKIRTLIPGVYENRLEEVVIYLELFVEIYTLFIYEWREKGELPSARELRKILYWFNSDYAEVFDDHSIGELFCTDNCFVADIVRDSNLNDLRYLYAYGEYISENELETAKYLNALPEETIALMADTYTEGYRKGFELAGIDLSEKTNVTVSFRAGFERMIRRAIGNFEKMGLQTAIVRAANSFTGGIANRQLDYDHKDDQAMFLDKNYINRRLEVYRAALEKYKKEAAGCAGPAVVETFGNADFEPENKKSVIRMTPEQNKQWLELTGQRMNILREYVPWDKRSFTIIAFPVPEIGPVFRELFDETIRINTLDYILYRDVQQKLIDVLDQADYCVVKGGGDNRTDLRVNLWKLKNPEKETIFENCVADVNIPVGEVFTSPVLEGTNGILHVTRVFLRGLEFRNLSITLENGMVKDYTCDNFKTEEENRSFVKENILYRNETMPIGEFAIGTNTTAYVVAKRLGVEAKLPILIAEKTGPHFAIGDTCYAHAEENAVFNPDGKEVVARENEKSRLRKTKPEEAYFHYHTDITIPYDELEELTAVQKNGESVPIIQKGRFVLPGTEPLNEAFGQNA